MRNNLINNDSESSTERVVGISDRDMIVVANAGAGKTTLLVEHYFELMAQGSDPSTIIAFTFTEKAAAELKARILKRLQTHPAFAEFQTDLLHELKAKILKSCIGTIHQFCLRVLEESQSSEELLRYKIIDEAIDLQLRESCLRQQLRQYLETENAQALLLLNTYGLNALQELLRQYQQRFSEETVAPMELPDLLTEESSLLQALHELSTPIAEQIQREKKLKGWLSFEDLERDALSVLRNPSSNYRKKLRFFQHILVDEFQDTSPIQIKIIEALRHTGTLLRLFCVGDPKQSIYRFRNVDRSLIEQTEKQILKDGGIKWDSVDNYRSVSPILKLVNAFSQGAFPQSKPSQVKQPDTPDSRAWLCPIVSEGEEKDLESFRQLEASQVAEEIGRLQNKGIGLEDIAVLYRASASALPLIHELKQRNIPFTLRAGEELLKRQEIIDLKRLLYFLSDPSDEISLIGVLRSPIFLISDATLYYVNLERDKEGLFAYLQSQRYVEILQANYPQEIDKLQWTMKILQQLLERSRSLSPYFLLKEFSQHLNLPVLYSMAKQATEAALCIEQWLDWLREIEAENAPPNLVSTVRLLKDIQNFSLNQLPLSNKISSRNAVQLLTIHAAKGLEFDTVFLIDLVRGKPTYSGRLQSLGKSFSLKISSASGDDMESPRFEKIKQYHADEDLEESKRLLYVALTRAEKRLMVFLHPKPQKNSLQATLMTGLGEAASEFIHPLPPSDSLINVAPPASKPSLATVSLSDPVKLSIEPEFTVSELETFKRCPLQHHYAYRRQIPDTGWEEPGTMDPTELGTLLHQAMDYLHSHSASSPRDAIERVLLLKSHRPEEATILELTQDLEKYLASPSYDMIRKAEEDYSELPFLLQLPSGRVRGQIDRLIRNRDGWILLDFKYAKKHYSKKQLLDNYGFQLKTYALAAQKIQRRPLHSIQIHSLGESMSHEVIFNEAELEEQSLYLEKLFEEIRQADLRSVESRPACYSCAFNRSVPICPIPRGRPLS